MAKDRSHMTEKILNLTLEFIYLLTGERCAVVKMAAMESLLQGMYPPLRSSEGPTSAAPPPPAKPERNHQQKILEVSKEMIDLLTREDVAIYFSMEEREYLEDQKEVEHQQLLPSGGARNATENPCPLYSQDSTQEVLPHHYQEEKLPGYRDGTAVKQAGVGVQKWRIKEEELSPEIGTDGQYTMWNMEEQPFISTPCKTEDDTAAGSSGEVPDIPSVDPKLHCADLSSDLSTYGVFSPERSHPVSRNVSLRAPKLFPCSVCGKFFRSAQRAASHQKSHAAKKPYSCSECGKSFSYKSKLLSHEVVHKVEKPFSCSECGKSFTQKSNLTVHKTLHAPVKPYSCSECGKCFFNKSRLTTHERVHTTDKMYFCSECGKCFSRKSNLIIHRRGHRGENQLSCPECGKIFPTKSELTRHGRVHTGERPFPCTECGKRFSNKRALANHEKNHEEVTQRIIE